LLLAAWITNDLAGRTAILLAILIALNAAARLYSSRLTMSVLDDLPSLLGRGLAAAAITTSVGLLVDHRLATGVVIGTAALYVPFVLAFRAVGYTVARAVRRHRLIVHSTLVLGAGEVGGQLTQLMLDHPEYGLLPVGFLDDDPLLPPDKRPVPVLGGVSNLAEVVAEFGVTQVLIAFGAVRES